MSVHVSDGPTPIDSTRTVVRSDPSVTSPFSVSSFQSTHHSRYLGLFDLLFLSLLPTLPGQNQWSCPLPLSVPLTKPSSSLLITQDSVPPKLQCYPEGRPLRTFCGPLFLEPTLHSGIQEESVPLVTSVRLLTLETLNVPESYLDLRVSPDVSRPRPRHRVRVTLCTVAPTSGEGSL